MSELEKKNQTEDPASVDADQPTEVAPEDLENVAGGGSSYRGVTYIGTSIVENK